MNLRIFKRSHQKDSESGAALVMALMVMALMMIGVGGLLLETSRNTQNVTDSTAEEQAYNAAESGIQSAINVLRYKCTASVSPCQVAPSPLLNTALTDYNKANSMNYARALNLATSNAPGDTSGIPRLSRWISYDSTATDRVKLAPPSVAYTAMNGSAFSLELADPDNTASTVSLSTSGLFFDHDAGNVYQRTYGSGANQVLIRYIPADISNLNVSGGSANLSLGTFIYIRMGSGAIIPALNRFEVDVTMELPFYATRTLRGFIEPTTTAGQIPKIIFDSQTYDIHGSDITLNLPGATMRQTGTQPYGYELTMPFSGMPLSVTGTITAPPPSRLLIRSTGYGPRGSRKMLEAIIQSNYFNGLGAPATITMVGPPNTTNPSTSFAFDPGSSNAMLYSGQDAAAGSSDIIPPIGVSDPIDPITGEDPNLDVVVNAVGGKLSDNVVGVPSNVGMEMPPWLRNPYALDTAVKALYNVALNSADPTNPTGRYFPSGVNPTTWGDNATATGITFCDGDCVLGPADGGGILVVTGTLTLHGTFSFNGLIIVTGQGGVIRSGGGTGLIQGNLVIAPYVASSIADNVDPAKTDGFLAPQYHTEGGGNSTITYNSNNQLSGLTAISNVVLGVAEK
jgi:Tfp pilus assembly protein PilX